MTHGRRPRKQRHVSLDPMRLARNSATRLTPAEIAITIEPIRHAARLTREGVATERDWALLASAVNIAKAIERQGVVRGLAGHLEKAEEALNAICRRALASGEWRPTALYWQELEHINDLVDLHEFQLGQLSYGEAHRATRRAVRDVQQAGGRVVMVDQVQEALL